jgi:hypothetical protein
MATAFPDSEELKANFEKVLLEKIRQHNSDVDESLASYICSIVSDEETPDEDKAESIEPILQELNQVVFYATSFVYLPLKAWFLLRFFIRMVVLMRVKWQKK